MTVKSENKLNARAIYTVAALSLILGVAALSIGLSSLFQNPHYCVLSGVKETKVTYVESPLVNTTQTLVYQNDNWTASYELGKPLILDESLYTTSKTGVTTISNVISNTPGFIFKESNISLPAFVPYASNISAASQKVELTFQTPSTQYVGDFEYTVFYNLTLP